MKGKLEEVSGIGVVHDYERWASNWKDLLTLYQSNGKLNGWSISRRSTAAEWVCMPEVDRRHNFVITGIYSLDDSAASEKTFQDLIEGIEEKIRNDHTLGDTCVAAGPLQVETVEVRMFGSVLCHYCELSLAALEKETQG